MAERRTVLDGSPVFWLFLKFVALGPALRLLFRPKVTGLEHIPRGRRGHRLQPCLVPGFAAAAAGGPAPPGHVPDQDQVHRQAAAALVPDRRRVIPVATDDLGAARNSVSAAVEAVQSGRPVGIFPEGTRLPDGLLHLGKTGVARIALQSGVPVIPAGATEPVPGDSPSARWRCQSPCAATTTAWISAGRSSAATAPIAISAWPGVTCLVTAHCGCSAAPSSGSSTSIPAWSRSGAPSTGWSHGSG